eukprot:CAMPEP_0195517272 /NCGR_PEP_ID=MMETSP0794_2-20130614/10275_1 /TAXON_ID=515487 /ORGANISM="Stephanopyxis turris, Strain CCMP 815" /LENGTH=1070 /DNA_ID=CAMNT_0040646047 /DNA_START=151 /DNA_END=3363 /DNA_ORIENTATION=-
MATTNSRRAAALKRKNIEIADRFKGHCPPHRVKDLEPLVKSLKGDEDAIRARIQEWWDEPEPTAEPEWEVMNKKSSSRSTSQPMNGHGGRQHQHGGGGYRGDRGGRSAGGGGGGRFRGRGGSTGGRGSGPAMRYSGERGSGRPQQQRDSSPTRPQSKKQEGQLEGKSPTSVGPAPVANVPKPKSGSAWDNPPVTQEASTVEPEPEPVIPQAVGVVTAQDPTPAGLVDTGNTKVPEAIESSSTNAAVATEKNIVATALTPAVPPVTGGNVWATKGSAHLIEAAKPRPPPPVPVPAPAQTVNPVTQQPASPDNQRRDQHRGGGRPGRGNKPQPQEKLEADLLETDTKETVEVPQETFEQEPFKQETLKQDAFKQETFKQDPFQKDIKEQEPFNQDTFKAELETTDSLDAVLPASVTGENVNAPGWKPLETKPQEIEQAAPLIAPDTSSPAKHEDAKPALEQSSFDDQKSTENAEPKSQAIAMASDATPTTSAPTESTAQPSTVNDVLNMGRWEVSEEDGLDFGFGSFGPDGGEAASVDETDVNNLPIQETTTSQPQNAPLAATRAVETTPTAVTVSPARPPPGLSISGMPPMPPNAVLVHELEGQLESASLAAQKVEETKEVKSSVTAPAPTADKPVEKVSSLAEKKPQTQPNSQQPSAYPATAGTTPADPSTIPISTTAAAPLPQQNYPPYASMAGAGAYGYGSNLGGANTFVGMPTLQGVTGGVVPQPQKPPQQQAQQQQTSPPPPQQGGPGQQNHQQQPHQSNLYGAVPTAGANAGAGVTEPSANSNDAAANPAANLPPGMHNAMPFQPALYYGQQFQHMGQPHAGYGYGYGAQFPQGVQGGYGYPLQGQNTAYGQPYEDHAAAAAQQQHHNHGSSHHSHNSSTHQHQGYQKNNHGGGYRGRNNHHSSHNSGSHQGYQNQPAYQQHAGYGAQPYGMGYNVDHFSNRGGYPGGNMDPYTMQSNSAYQGGIGGPSNGGFSSGQDDNDRQTSHGKGKSNKGNNRGSNNNGGFNGGNPNMQQFQQQGPHQQGGQGHQQPFGLQQGAGVADASSGNAGWSQSWSGPSGWQGGGN